jgi:hypothetical protein
LSYGRTRPDLVLALGLACWAAEWFDWSKVFHNGRQQVPQRVRS